MKFEIKIPTGITNIKLRLVFLLYFSSMLISFQPVSAVRRSAKKAANFILTTKKLHILFARQLNAYFWLIAIDFSYYRANQSHLYLPT